MKAIVAVEHIRQWLASGPGRTQRHVAAMLGVDISTINGYLNRRRLPKRHRVLVAIAALRLDDGPYELYEGG